MIGATDLAGETAVGDGAAPAGIANAVAFSRARWACGRASSSGADIRGAAIAAGGAGRADSPARCRPTPPCVARLSCRTTLTTDGTKLLRPRAAQLFPVTGAKATRAITAGRLSVRTARRPALGIPGGAAAARATRHLIAGATRNSSAGRRWWWLGRLRWQCRLRAGRRRTRISTPGCLGVTQNGPSGRNATKSE
jgi:hypothetical protein